MRKTALAGPITSYGLRRKNDAPRTMALFKAAVLPSI
jgi:hypothetical protein